MKKYGICLFLFAVVGIACLFTGYVVTKQYQKTQSAVETELSTVTVTENQMVANQEQVRHETVVPEESYYLVAEDGFLLVFLKDKKTICLYTHVPLMDFPERERERLRAGIWFSSMIEVFNYLESYTS